MSTAHTFAPMEPLAGRATNELLVVRLRGTQPEMGWQHGRILRDAGGWEKASEYYPHLPGRLLADGQPGNALERWTNQIGVAGIEWALKRMERARPAAYLERTRAFAEALDQDPGLSRYMMIMDVFQNVVGLAGRYRIGPFRRRFASAVPPACSTLMVWGDASSDGEVRHARNFDLPGIGVWDSAPEVVFCEPDEGLRYGFVTTRGADTPGVTAFNEAGLVVTLHTRFHRDVRFDGAAVVDLGHEIVRRAETLADAAFIARERPVCSTWGIAVSSASQRRGIVIETTGRDVVVLQPTPGDDFLMATNRYRHPLCQEGQVASSAAWAEHSDGREARLRAITEAGLERGGLTAADLERALGDHEDPSTPGVERAGGSVVAQPITVKSVVAEPVARRIRVSAGAAPASWGPFAPVAWSWDGEVGLAPTPETVPTGEPSAIELRQGQRFRSGPGARGYAHFVEAHRIEMETHDEDAILTEIERAMTADPDEPTYRFLAGGLLMKKGRYEAAIVHFERGLSTEKAPFRRGQLLLWASRTCDAAGRRVRAAELRAELLALEHRHLAEHHRAARAEARRSYPRRRLRAARVNLELLDLL